MKISIQSLDLLEGELLEMLMEVGTLKVAISVIVY
jgi:hypothetical protein